MKTSELTGPALDWAVAKCEGAFDWRQRNEWHNAPWQCSFRDDEEPDVVYHRYLNELEYSIDWAQGGPIIEREKIAVEHGGEAFDAWVAKIKPCDPDEYEWVGPTPLIAAMRCFVASKLGDEIEIPEELK